MAEAVDVVLDLLGELGGFRLLETILFTELGELGVAVLGCEYQGCRLLLVVQEELEVELRGEGLVSFNHNK